MVMEENLREGLDKIETWKETAINQMAALKQAQDQIASNVYL